MQDRTPARSLHDELDATLSKLSIGDPDASIAEPSANPGIGTELSTLYVQIASPPTPAPSPRPKSQAFALHGADMAHLSRLEFASLKAAGPIARQQYLATILGECTPAELLFVSTTIAPLLKRDFLRDLPLELCYHILSYVDDPRTLARASRVSKHWNGLAKYEGTWKRMCELCEFEVNRYPASRTGVDMDMEYAKTWVRTSDFPPGGLTTLPTPGPPLRSTPACPLSYMKQFVSSYKTLTNWRRKGRLLNKHRPPTASPDGGVVTSVAIDHEWIVVGLASSYIQVFSTRTGVLSRTLRGHESGVWAVHLVSAGGRRIEPPASATKATVRPDSPSTTTAESAAVGVAADRPGGVVAEAAAAALRDVEYQIPGSLRIAIGLDKPRNPLAGLFDEDAETPEPALEDSTPRPSDVWSSSEGWGQANALVVSGGCDKELRVWDVKSGYCIYVLRGHTSTIRCIRVLHNRPVAVSGSRDATLRVWDVQRGRIIRTLVGHEESVRCLDVCGNKVVSGSYDCTCRIWNIDTGECLQVLRGHLHQIYSVAFAGAHIASGGLDTTVRVWNPDTGECLALLQGHTALVCQLQLYGDTLATGGSDGRVITFSLATMTAQRRIAAHDSSVTALQYDPHFLVTGGNDGRVRLYDSGTGNFVRDLTQPAEAVWKVVHRYDKCVVMCKRAGKTVMEIWSFRPSEEDD